MKSFYRSQVDINFLKSGHGKNDPYMHWRENQKRYELYFPGIISGSILLKTIEMAEHIVNDISEHFSRAGREKMPVRGDAAKPFIRRKNGFKKRAAQ